MPNEKTVEELVDKIFDDTHIKSEIDDEDIKKRRPKPFRYLTDQAEIKAVLQAQSQPASIMKQPESPKIVDDFMKQVGMGDIETIENVIRRHQISKKFKER